MEVGVVLPRALPRDELVDLVSEIERLGYESIWVTEHIAIPVTIKSSHPGSPDGRPTFRFDTPWFEAMSTLSFVAALTRTIRIGTSVVPMFSRDPLFLAKQAATVDVLSNGRLELGVGAGWLVEEGAILGHPTDHRAERLDEAIQIMQMAWTRESFDYVGKYYRFPVVGLHPHPIQSGGVPIWIGGTSSAALRTARLYGTGLILSRLEPGDVQELADRSRIDRPDLRIAAYMPLGMRRDLMATKALAYRRAGADRLLLRSEHDTAGAAIADLRWFSKSVHTVLATN